MSESILIGDYTLDINQDDRGHIVAEVWRNGSGKTLGITECASTEQAKSWAQILLSQNGILWVGGEI